MKSSKYYYSQLMTLSSKIGKINEELKAVYDEVNRTFDEFAKDKIVIYG